MNTIQQPSGTQNPLSVKRVDTQFAFTSPPLAVTPADYNQHCFEFSKTLGRSVIPLNDEQLFLNPCVPLEKTHIFEKVIGKGAYGSVSLWRNSKKR